MKITFRLFSKRLQPWPHEAEDYLPLKPSMLNRLLYRFYPPLRPPQYLGLVGLHLSRPSGLGRPARLEAARLGRIFGAWRQSWVSALRWL